MVSQTKLMVVTKQKHFFLIFCFLSFVCVFFSIYFRLFFVVICYVCPEIIFSIFSAFAQVFPLFTPPPLSEIKQHSEFDPPYHSPLRSDQFHSPSNLTSPLAFPTFKKDIFVIGWESFELSCRRMDMLRSSFFIPYPYSSKRRTKFLRPTNLFCLFNISLKFTVIFIKDFHSNRYTLRHTLVIKTLTPLKGLFDPPLLCSPSIGAPLSQKNKMTVLSNI